MVAGEGRKTQSRKKGMWEENKGARTEKTADKKIGKGRGKRRPEG